MPRSLKILKSFIEQDPSTTRDKINELLGETLAVVEESLKYLSTCLRFLLNKGQDDKAVPNIFDLGVRFWNDIRAANILIREGFILNAMMMERDAIETRVVTEYLYKNPQEAKAWWKAQTLKERRRFSIPELKDKVTDGKEWESLWKTWSSYIHPTSRATPVYGRMRPFFGYNLYLGGFYDPISIANSVEFQLFVCINFLKTFMSWYKDDLLFPSELPGKLEALDKTFHTEIVKLHERAGSEQQKIDDKIEPTRLSKEEVSKLLKFLDTLP